MNINEEDLRKYIELFHATLDSTAEKFLSPEHRIELLHRSLLPAHIIGYVSTQFGAAIEYVRSDHTEIQIVRGSKRIEEIFVQAPAAVHTKTPLIEVQNVSTSLYRVKVSEDFPFVLIGPKSALKLTEVEFKIGSWSRTVEHAVVYGNRTIDFWSSEQAVARAKDEVLAALLQAKRAEERKLSLFEYIKKFKERTVLLLGDYSGEGLKRLKKIQDLLCGREYDAIMIKDIPDQPVQSLPQKVRMIGNLARFVIVDDSSNPVTLWRWSFVRRITGLLSYYATTAKEAHG